MVDNDNQSSEKVEEMMKHLDDIKRRPSSSGCKNCKPIDRNTRLSSGDGVELHRCARCERIISDEEYFDWQDVHRDFDPSVK